jgi:EAL domain-containing protein (putative c-di-GMP-specific phosphodiesterase class I)
MKENIHFISYKKGEQIFKVGDHANCAYIVESGTLGIYPASQDDEIIALMGKGELLGEMGILDKSNRSSSAFAETDLVLMIIDKAQISNRLQNADPIIRGVMEVLLRRIRNLLGGDSSQLASNKNYDKIVADGLGKMRFEKELFQAMENDEIVNVYQPMVCLKGGYIAGFEALSRWKHPEKGMVSPFEFITLAEESDLIVSMGIKIFENACRQLAVFQQIRDDSNSPYPPLFMSINVSANQLTAKDFLLNIQKITLKNGINPENIKIEITESLVVDYKKVKTWIDDCHNLGFKLSLDDFGTGYSGFQHLLELDFHTIKIDQAFTKSMDTNPKSMIMLEVITDMAKRLNMSIVAEGIENLEDSKKLTEIGVDYGQGYFFYKPMLVEDILKLLSS